MLVNGKIYKVAVDYQERPAVLCMKRGTAGTFSDSPEWTKRTWNSDLYHAAVYKRTWNDSAGDYRSAGTGDYLGKDQLQAAGGSHLETWREAHGNYLWNGIITVRFQVSGMNFSRTVADLFPDSLLGSCRFVISGTVIPSPLYTAAHINRNSKFS